MDLRLSLKPRITVKTYLFVFLLVLILFSLTYSPILKVAVNLSVVWVIASVLELVLNAWRKKIIHLPDSALVTATIITSVLSLSTPIHFIVLAVILAILSKHFIRAPKAARHIFNPANLAILITVFVFSQQIEWWAASNLILIIGLGSIVMYKLRRPAPPFVFLASFFLLTFLTTPDVNLQQAQQALTGDFSVYYFAFVMLPEPQTAAWSTRGRIATSILTAVVAVVLGLFSIKAPLIVALALVNLLTPIVNRFTKEKVNER